MARSSVGLLVLLCSLATGCLDWPEELLRPDGVVAVDAPGGCPASCINKCSQGICEIDCRKAACVCPPGYPCTVKCNAKGECPYTIDCSKATRCTIRCEGENSCAGSITCGPGFCSVVCAASGSCGGGVDCRSSCGCAVQGTSSSTLLCPPLCKNGCRTINSCDNC